MHEVSLGTSFNPIQLYKDIIHCGSITGMLFGTTGDCLIVLWVILSHFDFKDVHHLKGMSFCEGF